MINYAMNEAVLRFETKQDAYGYLSESRRMAADMLWEVRVEHRDDAWLVHFPLAAYKDGPADSLDKFHGTLVALQ